MILNINRNLHDNLYQLVSNKQIDFICFEPIHKGLDIFIEGAIEKELSEKLREDLSSFWFENDIIYSCSLTPKLLNDELYFLANFESDLVLYGAAHESWDIKHLIEFISPVLKDIIDEELFSDNLSLTLEADFSPNPDLSFYDLQYFLEGSENSLIGSENSFMLTDNEAIRNTILNYVKDWGVNQLYECPKDNISFRVYIESSYLLKLIEFWSIDVHLEIL